MPENFVRYEKTKVKFDIASFKHQDDESHGLLASCNSKKRTVHTEDNYLVPDGDILEAYEAALGE